MSFTGPFTQEDLWAPKILVAVEKGKKKKKEKWKKLVQCSQGPSPPARKPTAEVWGINLAV